MTRRLAWLGAGAMVALLAGCGGRADLRPVAGRTLPVAPYGRAERPVAAELLSPPPQARPGRAVELRQKSEPRLDDPFDLPPQE